MIDDVSDISAFYNSDPDREHIRLERHQLEIDLTRRYFDQYLPTQGSILEIGAATGRYTLELAKRGYAVTAVDISAALLDSARQHLAAAGLDKQVHLVVADARDLAEVSNREFDAVLLMGPLYHLVEESDRRAALQQAYDRLRPGGMIFSAFISRLGMMGDLIRRDPGWIEEDEAEVQGILTRGRRADDLRRGGFRGYFALVSEIAPLHETGGFETLIVAGVEPAISADDESYNKLEGRQRQLWLDMLYRLSTEPSIIGASRHLIYIGRKKG
jgi:SAM-dependent methyltransferase